MIIMIDKRGRIIDRLRKHFGGNWKYNPYLYRWERDDGFYVLCYSVFSPKYDGDDDSFRTEYYTSDGDLIFGLK